MPEVTTVRSVEQIQQEMDTLAKEMALAKKTESKEALAKVKQLVAQFDFTSDQIFSETSTRAPAEAKYKNPDTGDTWSGRGRAPKWLEGKDKSQFLIG